MDEIRSATKTALVVSLDAKANGALHGLGDGVLLGDGEESLPGLSLGGRDAGGLHFWFGLGLGGGLLDVVLGGGGEGVGSQPGIW